MVLLRFRPILVAIAVVVGDFTLASAEPRNLFAELLGKSDVDLDAKIDAAWAKLFRGDPREEAIYVESANDTAYIADIGNGDVRSEGISYGMMIAVQLDRKEEFDRLWRWAHRHMRHASGERRGYFAWQSRFDGTVIDPGSASDGEVWIATALFFASHRWGDGDGILNYGAEAQALLREILHKPATETVTPIFDRARRQIVFAPTPEGARLTDPSYQLPAFLELWARWAEDPADREFWRTAVHASREHLRNAAHPTTGLMPEYSHFDGSPYTGFGFGPGKGDFRFDAWRTLANVALDHAWWRADPWQPRQSDRVLRFLLKHAPDVPNQFTLDGRPLSTDVSTGLISMAAVAGLAAEPELARPFVEQLWNAPIPRGHWRYYDGLLYFLGLLQAGGRFEIHAPQP